MEEPRSATPKRKVLMSQVSAGGGEGTRRERAYVRGCSHARSAISVHLGSPCNAAVDTAHYR